MTVTFGHHYATQPAFGTRPRYPYHAAPARFGATEPTPEFSIAGELERMVAEDLETLAREGDTDGVAARERAIMSVVNAEELKGQPVAELIRAINQGLKQTRDYVPSVSDGPKFLQWLSGKEAAHAEEVEALMDGDEWVRHRMGQVFMA